MAWSQTKRGNKILTLGLGVLALAILLGIASTANQRQIGANTPGNALQVDEDTTAGVSLVLKLVSPSGNPAFGDVDLFRIGSPDCDPDPSKVDETDGFLGKTNNDGTVSFAGLTNDQHYSWRFTPVTPDNGAVATTGSFSLGNPGGKACKLVIAATETEPITLKVTQ